MKGTSFSAEERGNNDSQGESQDYWWWETKKICQNVVSFFSSQNGLQVERCSALLDTQFPKETILIFSGTEKAN